MRVWVGGWELGGVARGGDWRVESAVAWCLSSMARRVFLYLDGRKFCGRACGALRPQSATCPGGPDKVGQGRKRVGQGEGSRMSAEHWMVESYSVFCA